MACSKPLLDNLRYCARCNIPETQEGVVFDEMGICQACQSSEQKIHIDWDERFALLQQIVAEAKSRSGNSYDCILPVSGGKDSTYQAYVLVEVLGLKPLCVTFNHNWMSETGWHNLQNLLQRFNLDHVMFTPNRALVNRLARRSLEMIGDACWHCHSGVPAFVLSVAVKFNIPLIIWGESIAEASGRASYKDPVHRFDREYFLKVSSKIRPELMVCDYLRARDLYPFALPSAEELEAVGVYGLHLGDYIFWDEERQVEFIREHYGWLETEMEGAYKGYKSAECIMAGVHDFTCYLKRGYARGSFQASVDVRNGLLTRAEGFELAKKCDTMRPEALDYFLKATGMTEEEFYDTMRAQMHPKIKGTQLPVTLPERPNRERLKPFSEHILETMAGRRDPREG